MIEALIEATRPVRFRGKIRIAGRLVPPSGIRTAKIFGAQMQLDLANHIDRLIYVGCYEPLNTYRFRRILRPGMTAFDVGANIGYFSALASSLVGPSGQVHAFEPHPDNSRALAGLGLKNVRATDVALSDDDQGGRVFQFDQSYFPNRTATMFEGTHDGRSHAVRTMRLDDYVRQNGVKRIDLLKIDVDGFETKILAGAEETLASGIVEHLLVELDPFWFAHTGITDGDVAKKLIALGFVDLSDRDRLAAAMLGPTRDRVFKKMVRFHG